MKKFNSIIDFIKKSSHTAIIYQNEKITYNSLYINVCKFSNYLEKKFKFGDKILIMMDDSPNFIYLFLGALKSGIVPYLLNPNTNEKDLRRIISEINFSYIFNNDIKEFIENANDETDKTPTFVDENFICFYLFSSGTTGYLKAIPHKHKDIIFIAENYSKKVLKMTSEDISFSSAKLFFAYGLGNSLFFPFYNHSTVILLSEKSNPKNTLNTIQKYKPTIYFGVPSLFSQQIKLLRTKKIDINSLKFCVSAGEALPKQILIDWKKITEKDIIDGIGSTEALHIFISNSLDDIRPDCSGKLVSGFEAKITDKNDKLVEDDIIGNLKIKGISLPTEDWFDTGDMFLKKGEHYYYKGRSNDMIKISGMWVSPIKIESKILELEFVSEVAIVENKTLDGLNKIKSFVVLNAGIKSQLYHENIIKKKCIDELDHYHCPTSIEFIDELPKTDTGKIQRYKLKN